MLTVVLTEGGHAPLTTTNLTPVQVNKLITTISEQIDRETTENPHQEISVRIEVHGRLTPVEEAMVARWDLEDRARYTFASSNLAKA